MLFRSFCFIWFRRIIGLVCIMCESVISIVYQIHQNRQSVFITCADLQEHLVCRVFASSTPDTATKTPSCSTPVVFTSDAWFDCRTHQDLGSRGVMTNVTGEETSYMCTWVEFETEVANSGRVLHSHVSGWKGGVQVQVCTRTPRNENHVHHHSRSWDVTWFGSCTCVNPM